MATKFTPDVTSRSGVKPTEHTGLSSAETYTFKNNGSCTIRVKNGTSAAVEITVITQSKVDGQTIENRKVKVEKSETKEIGPFPTSEFNNEEGLIEFKISSATEVTIEIIQLGT